MEELPPLGEDEGSDSFPVTAFENSNTLDTLVLEQVSQFVRDVESLREEDDGIRLWVLVRRLPSINGAVGLGHTTTRILKYLNTVNCIPESLKGKTASTIKSKQQLLALEQAFIDACASRVHMSLLRRGILLPFPAHIRSLDDSSTFSLPGRNSTSNKGFNIFIKT
jgi:hypothetical protein